MFRVPNNTRGLLDQDVLKTNLIRYANENKSIICTFSAASNVTGIQTNVDQISTLVHEYKGLIFWDYAAAAPYVHIDMNPSESAAKDAIFVSPHKFIGGPGTPGKLCQLYLILLRFIHVF
jgi:selenocysteine lyase/cysteine desulfurase